MATEKQKGLLIETHGERLYDITQKVQEGIGDDASGILFLFCLHTSCALTISEAYDPSARQDLEAFFNHIAPRNLPFIRHTLEGEDDSPSHMKSALLQQHLALPVENGKLLLGQWQGIYLAEFRDGPLQRSLTLRLVR